MSSTYHLVCLGHNPLIVEDTTGRTSEEDALATRHRHPQCNVVIGRWSGGLVAIGCPPDGPDHVGWHRDTIWTPVEVLRLAAASVDSSDPRVRELARQLGACWGPERLVRLAPLIEVGQ